MYGGATYTFKEAEGCHPHDKKSKVESKCLERVFHWRQQNESEEDADSTDRDCISRPRRRASVSIVEVVNISARNPSNHSRADDLPHTQHYGHDLGDFAHWLNGWM